MRSDFGSGSLFPNSVKDESRTASIQLESGSLKSGHKIAQLTLFFFFFSSALSSLPTPQHQLPRLVKHVQGFFDVCAALSFCIANWAQSVLALIFNVL